MIINLQMSLKRKWFEMTKAAPFEQVHAFTHRSSMSATNNKKKTVEKIFFNGKGDFNKTTLF